MARRQCETPLVLFCFVYHIKISQTMALHATLLLSSESSSSLSLSMSRVASTWFETKCLELRCGSYWLLNHFLNKLQKLGLEGKISRATMSITWKDYSFKFKLFLKSHLKFPEIKKNNCHDMFFFFFKWSIISEIKIKWEI
jgi:hypothetical protein